MFSKKSSLNTYGAKGSTPNIIYTNNMIIMGISIAIAKKYWGAPYSS